MTDPVCRYDAALSLADAAEDVIATWEQGDLAKAVRTLDETLKAFDLVFPIKAVCCPLVGAELQTTPAVRVPSMTVGELISLLALVRHLGEVRVALLGEQVSQHRVLGIRTDIPSPKPGDVDSADIVWIAIEA